MLASVEEVVTDEKTRRSVLDSIKKIPISDSTNMRRVEALESDISDESTDNSDVAQLCLYVRFFDGECFREELLGLIPMEERTTGEILFTKITTIF